MPGVLAAIRTADTRTVNLHDDAAGALALGFALATEFGNTAWRINGNVTLSGTLKLHALGAREVRLLFVISHVLATSDAYLP